jgi:hypothetical protein
MVVSPILRGMMGLNADAIAHRVSLAPHLPPDWTSATLANLHVGKNTIALAYGKTSSEITLEVTKTGPDACSLQFSPAVSLHARILGASANGHPIAVQTTANSVDQHARIEISLNAEKTTVTVRVRDDFGVGLSTNLPALGELSRGARITSETWTDGNQVALGVSGTAGTTYLLPVWNPSVIASVKGGDLLSATQDQGTIRITMPGSANTAYVNSQVMIQLKTTGAAKKARSRTK